MVVFACSEKKSNLSAKRIKKNLDIFINLLAIMKLKFTDDCFTTKGIVILTAAKKTDISSEKGFPTLKRYFTLFSPVKLSVIGISLVLKSR